MRVCCRRDRAEYLATIGEVDAPELLAVARLATAAPSAAANDDDGWEFYESGERDPFEQIERFAERRKRHRFTQDMLRDGLRHFGIELNTDEFLRLDAATRAVRLQQVTKVWHTPKFTLEQPWPG